MANRTIKLTKPIRSSIVINVKLAWIERNPRPEMDPIPHSGQLRRLHEWQAQREETVKMASSALETFSTLNQLEDLWPAILPFVPGWVLDPEKNLRLP